MGCIIFYGYQDSNASVETNGQVISSLIVGIVEGENDGLLTPDAVRWTNFRGIYRGVGNRGISHCDEVDMWRRPLSRKKGGGVSDIVDFYKDVVDELCEKGF